MPSRAVALDSAMKVTDPASGASGYSQEVKGTDGPDWLGDLHDGSGGHPRSRIGIIPEDE
jgi:hypothetical protein